ncbi:MAG: hypothetical protein MUC54_03945 [Chloroflexi bacterium]|nr:hypothetical protein [Chloroflexota bacterium]
MSGTTNDAHPSVHEPDGAGHAHGHEEHGGHDEHAGHGAALGPIDWAAWGAGVVGVAAGLAVVGALVVATTL